MSHVACPRLYSLTARTRSHDKTPSHGPAPLRAAAGTTSNPGPPDAEGPRTSPERTPGPHQSSAAKRQRRKQKAAEAAAQAASREGAVARRLLLQCRDDRIKSLSARLVASTAEVARLQGELRDARLERDSERRNAETAGQEAEARHALDKAATVERHVAAHRFAHRQHELERQRAANVAKDKLAAARLLIDRQANDLHRIRAERETLRQELEIARRRASGLRPPSASLSSTGAVPPS